MWHGQSEGWTEGAALKAKVFVFHLQCAGEPLSILC